MRGEEPAGAIDEHVVQLGPQARAVSKSQAAPNLIETRPNSSSAKTKADPVISYRPCQSTAKFFSVSLMRAGRGSPDLAIRAARRSAGSRIQASPLSVENSRSGPIVT